MIRHRCALRRIPTTNLALRSAAYQSNTFKKGCDDDDAAARTNPRVSPGMREGCGEGGTQRPPRRNGGARRRHRVGVGNPTGISPNPQRTTTPDTPSRSAHLTTHHLAPPRSWSHYRRLTVVKQRRSTETRRDNQGQEAAEQRQRGRAQPPPPPAVTDRTWLQEQTRPLLARPSPTGS
jgi:hypothetical protein